MKIHLPNRNSIKVKLGIAFVIATLIQCIFMSATLVLSGVIEEAKSNVLFEFSEKVSGRQKSLQNQLNNIWINIDSYTSKISDEFTDFNDNSSSDVKNYNDILEKISPLMIEAIRTTNTTGVFFILNDNHRDSHSHSAIYIRDADPDKNNADNSDLSMIAAPLNVLQSTGITTSKQWSSQLQLYEENQDFYYKPYTNIALSPNKRLLAYWSPPFYLTPNDEKIITYSLPVTDNHGTPIGVFGVEISLNYLYKFLPANDLTEDNSYGYIIGIRNGENEPILPMITHGKLQNQLLSYNEQLILTEYPQGDNIYNLENHNNDSDMICSVNKLGLYYNNTPFENQEWYLIGLMEQSVLFQFANKITEILIVSFVISIMLGLFIAVLSSQLFTHPIIKLANQVSTGTLKAEKHLKSTGLSEIDNLSMAIITSENRLITLSDKLSRIIELTNIPFGAFEINNSSNSVFITNYLPKLFHLSEKETKEICENKNKFLEKLDEIYALATDDPEVFHFIYDDKESWIRIIQTQTFEGTLGIAQDVTKETLRTNSLKIERDYDSLTGIRNRHAYNQSLLLYNNSLTNESSIGIGVFDLNRLKFVNDTYGHAIGDEYICAATSMICSTFAKCPVFRVGGDEFVAILLDMDIDEAKRLHLILLQEISNFNKHNHYPTGIAFGYSFYNYHTDKSLDDVIKRADKNMYINKNTEIS